MGPHDNCRFYRIGMTRLYGLGTVVGPVSFTRALLPSGSRAWACPALQAPREGETMPSVQRAVALGLLMLGGGTTLLRGPTAPGEVTGSAADAPRALGAAAP